MVTTNNNNEDTYLFKIDGYTCVIPKIVGIDCKTSTMIIVNLAGGVSRTINYSSEEEKLIEEQHLIDAITKYYWLRGRSNSVNIMK